MNSYLEMKQRHQREVNDLPLFFAFSNEQFNESLQQMGLTSKDTDQLRSLGIGGGFYHKDNADKIHGTFQRHENERNEAIESDKKGNGYIYEMFLYELNNHEYGYTGDESDTFDTLGFTHAEVENNKALKFGFDKAVKRIMTDNDC